MGEGGVGRHLMGQSLGRWDIAPEMADIDTKRGIDIAGNRVDGQVLTEKSKGDRSS